MMYVLKLVAISGVLYGYYCAFLRNRGFHQWNRGFLLFTVFLAVVMPLVPMSVSFLSDGGGWPAGPTAAAGWRDAFHGVVPGQWKENEWSGSGGMRRASEGLDWSGLLYWVYGSVAVGLAFLFVRELNYIRRLYGRYACHRREGLVFFMTREPGAPFSFLRTIFWNEEIDMDSVEGRPMLRHEMVHVRQRHTVDLLVLRLVIIVFWCNPVFYLIYRELRTIHEFEADRLALEGEDQFAYAELLVRQTLDSRQTSLFHSFFSSSLKRRINMITQFSVSNTGRMGRWMVAPVALFLLCAFSGGAGHRSSVILPVGPTMNATVKPVTVIIDAGHGGLDDGAIASNGLKEKNINLSIAQRIRQLAPEYGVKVVLTRDQDVLAGGMKSRQASLHYRADLSAAKKADLFISLHTDAASGAGEAGFHIIVAKESAYFQKSVRLGGVLINALKPSYGVGDEVKEIKEHVWVLRAATVPAVLVLCGNIDDERDRAFISDPANQEKIARDILKGVVDYNGLVGR